MRRGGGSVVLLLASAACAQTATAPGTHARYLREVRVPATVQGQTCAVLDSELYPHAAASLKDLRLYAGEREVPYVMTLSESAQEDSEPARVLNLGRSGPAIRFDLEMPHRPYTEVVLDLAGENFLATARVSGSSFADPAGATEIGEFSLFDLSAQHLSRSTTLRLPESNFAYLHIELTVTPAPGLRSAAEDFDPKMVIGAAVPPSREAQTLYTVAAETHDFEQRGKETVARFRLPARVPVERVSVVLPSRFGGSFSRNVHVRARASSRGDRVDESYDGVVQRVQLNEGGRELRQEHLSVGAPLGVNLGGDAEVEVTIENGDDAPLPLEAVRLEMRERRLCFDVHGGSAGTMHLFYGDPGLNAPEYDYARLFVGSPRAARAELGPEETNPAWRPRADDRPLTERHPRLLWLGLIAAVCALALVAFRSSATPLR